MRIRIAVGLLLLAPALVACGSTYGTHGEDLSNETAALIVRGLSMSDVRGLVGEPTRVTAMGETRELWTYRYFNVDVDGRVEHRPVPPPEGTKTHPYHGAIYILFDSEGKVAMVRRG